MRQALDLLSLRLGREATEMDLRKRVAADLAAGDRRALIYSYYGLTPQQVTIISVWGQRQRSNARRRARRKSTDGG